MNQPRFQTVLKLIAGESSIPLMRLVWGEAVANFTVGSEGNWRVRAPGVEGRHVTFAFDGRQLFVASAPGRRDTFLAGAPIDERWWPVTPPVELRFGGAALQISAQQYSARPPPAGSEPPAAGPLPNRKETVLDGVGAWKAVHSDDAMALDHTQLPQPARRPAPQVHVQDPIEIRNPVMDARTVVSPQAPLAQPPPARPNAPAQGNVGPGVLDVGPAGGAVPPPESPETVRRPLTSKPPAPGTPAKDLRERHVGLSPWYVEPGPGRAPAGSPGPPAQAAPFAPAPVPPAPAAAPAAPAEPAPPFVPPQGMGGPSAPFMGPTQAVPLPPAAMMPAAAPITPPPGEAFPPRAASEPPAPAPAGAKGVGAAWRSISPVKKAIALLLPIALAAVLWPQAEEAHPGRKAPVPVSPPASATLAMSGSAAATSHIEAAPAGNPQAQLGQPAVAGGAGQVVAVPSAAVGAPSSSPPAAAATAPSAVSSGVAARSGGALERRALDAAFEGRFSDAATIYGELAAARPEQPVFREAARILRERDSRQR